MGTTFKYVSDEALEAHRFRDRPCPRCQREGNVFRIPAEPRLPGKGKRPIFEACVKCIRSMDLDDIDPSHTEKRIADYLRLSPRPLSKLERRVREPEICEELRRTPRLPRFLLRDDWPFCCNDIAEYTGEPSMARAEVLHREGQFWDRGPATFQQKGGVPIPCKALVAMGDGGALSTFRCRTCGKRYWTYHLPQNG